MGLFSSGGKGNSNARTQSATTTTSETNNFVDNRVYQSDFGAVQAATDLASDVAIRGLDTAVDVSSFVTDLGRDALDTSTANLNLGLDFARSSLENGYDFSSGVTSDAFGAVGDAFNSFVDTLGGGYNDTLTAVGKSQQSAFDVVGELVSGLFNFTTDTIKTVGNQASDLAGQSIAGNQSLARATSESGDDKIVRIGLYAFAAIAAILVIPAIFKK